AQRITVLRDGSVVTTTESSKLDHAHLVELITGHPDASASSRQVTDRYTEAVLEVRGLTASLIRDVGFDVAGGEIVGLAGLVGSGASEILECIFGARSPNAGTVTVAGRRLRGQIDDAIAQGVAHVPG